MCIMFRVRNVVNQGNYANVAKKTFGQRLSKGVRKIFLTAAVVGGVWTAASLFKTPGKTLNPHIATNPIYYQLCGPGDFEYDQSESIMSNVGYNLGVANDKLFTNVVDPVAEHPIIPTTATALALLGLASTKPKEDSAEMKDEAKIESV